MCCRLWGRREEGVSWRRTFALRAWLKSVTTARVSLSTGGTGCTNTSQPRSTTSACSTCSR